MSAPSTTTNPHERQLRHDYISLRGRVLTITLFGLVIVAMLATLVWIGAGRANAVFGTLGDNATSADQYQAAADNYLWALRFNGSDAHVVLGLGTAYQHMHHHPAVLEQFRRYIELQPALASSYATRAESYMALHQYALAIADYGSALERDPQQVAAFTGRARAHAAQMEWQPAISDMSRALAWRVVSASIFQTLPMSLNPNPERPTQETDACNNVNLPALAQPAMQAHCPTAHTCACGCHLLPE